MPLSLDRLEARRAAACRLTPELALGDIDEADAWARERGLVTRTSGLSLPSLHAACHEEPYDAAKQGFASWPRTRWWWGHALAERPGLRWLKILRGAGGVLVTDDTAALADSLARAELERAAVGELGDDARRLVVHLDAAGPSLAGEVREELDLGTKALRAARGRLERVAAVVSRRIAVGDDRYATELARWDQLFEPAPPARRDAGRLLVAGVRAAVLAPEGEARRWFAWPVGADRVDELVEEGALARVGGLLFSPASDS
jgi:hypothetical protein